MTSIKSGLWMEKGTRVYPKVEHGVVCSMFFRYKANGWNMVTGKVEIGSITSLRYNSVQHPWCSTVNLFTLFIHDSTIWDLSARKFHMHLVQNARHQISPVVTSFFLKIRYLMSAYGRLIHEVFTIALFSPCWVAFWWAYDTQCLDRWLLLEHRPTTSEHPFTASQSHTHQPNYWNSSELI